MIALATRRLAQLPPTLVVASMLMFLIMSLGPSPLAQMQEFSNLSAADIARISARYGWDQPLHSQYLHWLRHFVAGDFGTSVRTFQPAGSMILERLPITLIVASCALALSVGIGVPLGAYVAIRRNSRVDYVTTFTTLVMMAVPAFFMALVLQLVAVKLREHTGSVVFYTGGIPDEGAGAREWVQRLALPVLTLALAHMAIWIRYQRSELLGVLGQEYVRCARAKGIPERVVLMRHAMRNAILPIVTLVAMEMGKLVAGAIVVELIFGLPGMGTLLFESVTQNDTTIVLDILMIVAATMVVCNTAADLLYGVLDPRSVSS